MLIKPNVFVTHSFSASYSPISLCMEHANRWPIILICTSNSVCWDAGCYQSEEGNGIV